MILLLTKLGSDRLVCPECRYYCKHNRQKSGIRRWRGVRTISDIGATETTVLTCPKQIGLPCSYMAYLIVDNRKSRFHAQQILRKINRCLGDIPSCPLPCRRFITSPIRLIQVGNVGHQWIIRVRVRQK